MKVLLPDLEPLRLAFDAAALRRRGVEMLVSCDGLEAEQLLYEHRPRLAILALEAKGKTGVELCREARSRQDLKQTAIFLVADRPPTSSLRRQIGASGCDELIELPIRARQLLDRAALYLGLVERQPRLPVEILVDVAGIGATTSVNLSASGVLVRAPRGGLAIGHTTHVRLELGDADLVIAAEAQLVRVVADAGGGGTLLAFKFLGLGPSAQRALANLSAFQYEESAGWRHLIVRGAITESTQLEEIAHLLVGRVEMDLSGVTYINSWGTRAWIRLVAAARPDELVFSRCSVSFVLQAGMTEGFLGPGRIVSFYAPYQCAECELDELVLLEVTPALVAARDAPPRSCQRCGAPTVFDEIPAAFFSFLPD